MTEIYLKSPGIPLKSCFVIILVINARARSIQLPVTKSRDNIRFAKFQGGKSSLKAIFGISKNYTHTDNYNVYYLL